MSLTLPRSKFAISFSDALIFLCFLLYGGKAAIIVAAVETFANCLYLRSVGFPFGKWMIPTNISINTVATTFTYLVALAIPAFVGSELNPARSQHLITILGLLALTQFFVSSLFAAVFQSLKDGSNLFKTWRRDCFSSSMTQIVGAGLAGLVYKLINFGDVATAAIATLALLVAYLNYRQSIAEINAAFGRVEEAERQKSEAERERRLEAERHASQLSISLQKEEKANVALRKSERNFQYAALHDSLTNLANRKKLGDILRTLIRDYKDDPSVTFHVLFLDIRRFKNINDSLGHTIGDKVLMIAAKRFIRMLTDADVVARIGGDEFAIVLRNLSTAAKAQKVARRIYNSISQPFSLSGNRIAISVNIGIAPCDAEYNTPEEILRDADIAMHYAREKDSGVAVFSKELRDRFVERAKLEMDLRHAVERNELKLHYQPIVSLEDGRLIGFEALLRWYHDEVGLIPPYKFIPLAEETGLILPISRWILDTTCTQLKKWQQISSSHSDLIVSVNISGRHLSTDELIDDVEQALTRSHLRPDSLKLEITESTAMENAEHTINILQTLKRIGVQLSIDDFGTGYSSLSYLHRLPFDTLKIDRSFVNQVRPNGENSEVLQTIISLAKNLKMRVIAEGIETENQLSLLRNLGCDYGQGFLLSKPKRCEDIEKILYENPSWLPENAILDFDPAEADSSDAHLPVF
jgi:diguanylate cyclase (GGDEF)-like protein